MPQVIIGEEIFKSKKELLLYVRELLKKLYPRTIQEGREYNFLISLFERHPLYSTKKRDGIVKIIIARDAYQKNIQTKIITRDGWEDDISYIMSINAKLNTVSSLLNNSLRKSIEYQILDFRNSQIPGNSPEIFPGGFLYCVQCREYGKCEIDHVVPFKQLKEEFLALATQTLGFSPQAFQACGWENCTRGGVKFSSEFFRLENEWQTFHQENAILQTLCLRCHKLKTHQR